MEHNPLSTVIIGGAGGIGQALARRLCADGSRILIIGRDPARTAAVAQSLAVDHAVADARDSTALKAAVAAWGEPGAVVNLAGSILLKPAHLTRDEDWQETLAQNLTTAFCLAHRSCIAWLHALRSDGQRCWSDRAAKS